MISNITSKDHVDYKWYKTKENMFMNIYIYIFLTQNHIINTN
jgi:hypothetical protein